MSNVMTLIGATLCWLVYLGEDQNPAHLRSALLILTLGLFCEAVDRIVDRRIRKLRGDA